MIPARHSSQVMAWSSGALQLLLGLHDPGQALVTGHGMVLGGFADPCTHPVCLRCIVSWPENESDGLPEVGKLLLALSDVLGLGAKSVDHDLVLLGQAVLRHQVGSDGGDQR